VLCECCNVGHYLPWQLTTQRPLKQILCVGGVSQSIFTK
jgi:uracil-DNA glycosylase